MSTTQYAQGEAIIKNHVIYAFGGGLIPVPFLDLAAVTAVQLDMLKQLAKLYGADFSDNSGKAWISAIVGTSLAGIGSSLLKNIPIVGSILGGVSMSLFAGASTYGVGQVFLNELETKGNFADFDLEKAKEAYEAAYEKGKDLVKEWNDEWKAEKQGGDQPTSKPTEKATPKPPEADAPSVGRKRSPTPVADERFEEVARPETPAAAPEAEDALSKLERLAKMRNQGLITDEEFQTLKGKILGLF